MINLHENSPFFSSLIRELAENVTEPTIPFFSQIKLIQSDIEMNNPIESNVEERYFRALQLLFDIPLEFRNSIVQTQLDLLIKTIYNNNQMTFEFDPLTEALQKIKLLDFESAKSILSLLSKQNQRIKDLEQPINVLELK